MLYLAGKRDFCFEDTCVTLGKFDGIHRGHELLLEKMSSFPELKRVMFTFDLAGSDLLGSGTELIFTEAERRRYIEAGGKADILISYPFDSETMNMAAEDFIRDVLAGRLGAKAIVAGTDFRFGKGAKGDVGLLESCSERYGYRLIVCEKVRQDGEEISSTLIRKEIEKSNMERVTLLLGRPYSISGKVLRGKQIGRKMDFPTANLKAPEHKLLPGDGVYVGELEADGRTYSCISNVGTNPTVNDGAEGVGRTVESFCLNEDIDLYDREIEVRLLHFLREERKFESLSALKDQIGRDARAAKEWLNKKREDRG